MSFTTTTPPISDLISTATSPEAITPSPAALPRRTTYLCADCHACFTLRPSACLHCRCATLLESQNPNPYPNSNVDGFLGLIRCFTHLETEFLPAVAITSSMLAASDGGLACAVCHEEFAVGEEAKRLPCRHLYHAGCIEPWLERRSSCPVCRFKVPTAEEVAAAARGRRSVDWGFLQEEEVRDDLREMIRRYLNYLSSSASKSSPSQLAEVAGSEVSGPANSGETVSSRPRGRRVDDEVDSAWVRTRARYNQN